MPRFGEAAQFFAHSWLRVFSASIIPRAKTEAEIKADYERGKAVMGKSYPVKLGAFLKQTSLVVNGVLINREEIIKYVANKLGGAHYDDSRDDSTGTGDISLEQKYKLLDGVRSGIAVADRNAIYYELLSIGQRVVNSRDVRQLRKYLTHVLSLPPSSAPNSSIERTFQRPVRALRPTAHVQRWASQRGRLLFLPP
jgi:hypothetical protein